MAIANAAKAYTLTLSELEASALLGALGCVQFSETTAFQACEDICEALYGAGAKEWGADGAVSFAGAHTLPE
ncbi:hypothetical protein GCM10011289_02840 [Paludibacterium paludis]|uniref:Uncharacterized protein n=1 Tax=Paludibacterium paludis TaxID=1225769 RepID=A0A918NXT1_9NEIS|nr:hypothetical protein GCM10011289_02840 [Paludibacterium paludis]